MQVTTVRSEKLRGRGDPPPYNPSHRSFCFGSKEVIFFIDHVVTDLTVDLIFRNMLPYNSEWLANHLFC